jgi:hypothetical protein
VLHELLSSHFPDYSICFSVINPRKR